MESSHVERLATVGCVTLASEHGNVGTHAEQTERSHIGVPQRSCAGYCSSRECFLLSSLIKPFHHMEHLRPGHHIYHWIRQVSESAAGEQWVHGWFAHEWCLWMRVGYRGRPSLHSRGRKVSSPLPPLQRPGEILRHKGAKWKCVQHGRLKALLCWCFMEDFIYTDLCSLRLPTITWVFVLNLWLGKNASHVSSFKL